MSGEPSGSTSSTASPDTGTGTDTDDTTECLDPSGGWWDTRWSHRRQLTFDNSGQAEDLSNFTVLVVLSEDFDDSKAAPEGIDLRFVDSDQSTVLDHQIERWPPERGASAGARTVWVEVPQIDGASAEDHIWLYYGNPMATDTQDPAGSWDDGYVGVWHLEESAGTHRDSTLGITCDWEGGGGGSQDAPGWIAGAVDFDGGEDNIDCGVNQIANTEYHTITAWVRLDLLGDNHQQIVNVESIDNPYRGIGLYVRRQSGAIGMWLGSSYYYAAMPENRVTVDEWSFLAIRGRQANPGGYLEVSHKRRALGDAHQRQHQQPEDRERHVAHHRQVARPRTQREHPGHDRRGPHLQCRTQRRLGPSAVSLGHTGSGQHRECADALPLRSVGHAMKSRRAGSPRSGLTLVGSPHATSDADRLAGSEPRRARTPAVPASRSLAPGDPSRDPSAP